jgi:hypothetical protein
MPGALCAGQSKNMSVQYLSFLVELHTTVLRRRLNPGP